MQLPQRHQGLADESKSYQASPLAAQRREGAAAEPIVAPAEREAPGCAAQGEISTDERQETQDLQRQQGHLVEKPARPIDRQRHGFSLCRPPMAENFLWSDVAEDDNPGGDALSKWWQDAGKSGKENADDEKHGLDGECGEKVDDDVGDDGTIDGTPFRHQRQHLKQQRRHQR